MSKTEFHFEYTIPMMLLYMEFKLEYVCVEHAFMEFKFFSYCFAESEFDFVDHGILHAGRLWSTSFSMCDVKNNKKKLQHV